MANTSAKKKVKKREKVDSVGCAYVCATFNNTVISLTDNYGNVISWSSGGSKGRFKGSRKNTAFAAQLAAQDCAKIAMDLGLRKISVFVKGPGAGRESSVRALQAAGLAVTSIKDTTPVPHNGCRPRKKRRI
ncbi:MAG: 30S ribosomal protein S11 [Candidatus Delongbacteria bacterium]|nr:30S ribosomal protein S11 [Candidatus Delongbacteria bacterium]